MASHTSHDAPSHEVNPDNVKTNGDPADKPNEDTTTNSPVTDTRVPVIPAAVADITPEPEPERKPIDVHPYTATDRNETNGVRSRSPLQEDKQELQQGETLENDTNTAKISMKQSNIVSLENTPTTWDERMEMEQRSSTSTKPRNNDDIMALRKKLNLHDEPTEKNTWVEKILKRTKIQREKEELQVSGITFGGDNSCIDIPDTKMYVGNLPYETTADELRDLFQLPPTHEIHIPTHQQTGKPRGMALFHVSYAQVQTYLQFNEHEIRGRKISVQISNKQDFPGGKSYSKATVQKATTSTFHMKRTVIARLSTSNNTEMTVASVVRDLERQNPEIKNQIEGVNKRGDFLEVCLKSEGAVPKACTKPIELNGSAIQFLPFATGKINVTLWDVPLEMPMEEVDKVMAQYVVGECRGSFHKVKVDNTAVKTGRRMYSITFKDNVTIPKQIKVMGWAATTQYSGQQERLAEQWRKDQQKLKEKQEQEEKDKIAKEIAKEKERLAQEAAIIELERNMWLQTKAMEEIPSQKITCILTDGKDELRNTPNELVFYDIYEDLKHASVKGEIQILKRDEAPKFSRNDKPQSETLNIGIEMLMPMVLLGLHEKLPKDIFDEEYSPDLIKAFALHELFGAYIYYERMDDYKLWLNEKTLDHWKMLSYIEDNLYNDIMNALDTLFSEYRLLKSAPSDSDGFSY